MSMAGLNNSHLGMQLFLQIVDEYKGFIGGGGSNQNLFSFLDGNRPEEKQVTETLLKYAGERDQEQEALDLIKKRVFFPLLDNTSFAFTISDIVSGKAFKITNDSEIKDLEKYLYIAYENVVGKNLKNSQVLESFDPRSKNPSNQVSIKKMVRPVVTKFKDQIANAGDAFKDLIGEFQEDDKENPGQKKAIIGNFALREQSMDDIFINGGSGADGDAVPEPSRFTSPGLCGFVVRRPDVGIMARNADPINLFFNGISPLEMSRCVPYINVAVVTLRDEHRPKKMSNVTFMRFIKKDKTNYVLDEKIGLANARPQDNDMLDALFNSNKFGENIARDVSLMDIFTTTQTTSNANVNAANESLSHTGFGNHVLEPIAPFLTLNSLSVDISGMGIALFSSKVASMELTLHDRSRLSDISSLVAPNQFGMTKIIIEYGWSHPDGGLNSDNRIGQFLNSARDRGIFTVKSSNFSFSDGNTVKVSLSLSCYGADESKSISAAAGSKIPIAAFKPTIKKILNEIVEKGTGNARAGGKSKPDRILKHREIRQIYNVSQRNSTSTAALIKYSAYQDLVKLYYESMKSDGGADIEASEYITMLKDLLGDIDIEEGATKDELRESIKEQNRKREENATELLYGKLNALIGNLPEDLEDFVVDPFLGTVVDWADGKAIAAEYFTTSPEVRKPKVVSLGKIMMSFVGHSLAMSGLFDEVQMFFYPLNVNAGKARVHTTASMPIDTEALKTVVTKKIASDATVSINTMFNLMSRKLVRDNASFAYGMADIYTEYEEKKKVSKELSEEAAAQEKALDVGAAVPPAVKDTKTKAVEIAADAREQKKTSITDRCTKYYNTDGGPTAEATFVRPEISLFIEVLPSATMTGKTLTNIVGSAPAIEKEADGKDEDAKKYEKNICRVHIYDERAMAKPYESFLNSMLTEGSAGKAIVKGVKAEGGEASLDEVTIDDKTGKMTGDFEDQLAHYVLNAQPSKIKSIVKKGYPSITYGTSTGVVKSIGVSSNVSDNISQVLMISANAGARDIHDNNSVSDELEEMEVVPATVSLSMMGCPFIQRGNQIYIDFGTNTTLDNIYTVKSVKHALSAGDFSTTVDLIFTGQARVSSIRNTVKSAIDSLL